MGRKTYIGGSTIIRRSPLYTPGVLSERGPNAEEGEANVRRAAEKKRQKVIARIDMMNRPKRKPMQELTTVTGRVVAVPGDAAPTQEQMTIEMVMEAARIAFNPNDNREITQKQVVDLCCGIVKFLTQAGRKFPDLSVLDWRDRLEALQLHLDGDNNG